MSTLRKGRPPWVIWILQRADRAITFTFVASDGTRLAGAETVPGQTFELDGDPAELYLDLPEGKRIALTVRAARLVESVCILDVDAGVRAGADATDARPVRWVRCEVTPP